MNQFFGCLSDPFGCLSSGIDAWFWGLVGMVPWWGWALAALVVVGAVWKFAGWPGLLALAAAAGFVFGRRTAKDNDDPIEHIADASPFGPRAKPRAAVKKHRPTIFRP